MKDRAETLYEAAVLALKSFREYDCAPGPAAHLSVEVKNPSVTHTLVAHAVEDWVEEVKSITGKIKECEKKLEQIARDKYPETKLLKQVKGVGTLIALTFVLTLEDKTRFAKSRDAGCYVGLRPKRSDSGESQPQLRITKEGDIYLRKMLVQGAHHILGHRGADTDLRRWGLKLAERGGKNAKKRAIVAVARKLAVLLHHLWVSGEVYEPLRNAAQRSGLKKAAA